MCILKKLWLIFILGCSPFITLQAKEIKRIAISIDDAPSPSTPLFTGMQRTLAIINHLKRVNAPPVGVFAIGKHVIDFGAAQLVEYGKAGHVIGNHTFAHKALKNWTADAYVQDIVKADNLLKNMPGYAPMFRSPFLDEGYPQQTRQVKEALDKMGYIKAGVTVNNFDFYMESILQKALRQGKFIDFDKLGKVYLQVMLECIEFYDGLATLQKKHPINHVLLMHSNDLTALYIGDLVKALRQKGWKIISFKNAYKPLPEVLINLPGEESKEEKKVNPATLRNIPKGMSVSYLSELFKQEKVFVDVAPNQTYTAAK
ncbi:MAG: polysaccharide deacetylase family protein [Candidatus Paracaedibacteraceae bacterium]|nr:polysaccharide deacetylase family protein [Candidatus Paracaedibacteraceae bacterium]